MASLSKVEISRTSTKVVLTIYTARPGLVIGKSGSEVDSLKTELKKLIGYEVRNIGAIAFAVEQKIPVETTMSKLIIKEAE